jgi:uncharacterized protein
MLPGNQYHCAPMFDEPLPKQADLRKLTSRGASFVSQFAASSLPRIASAVYEGEGLIDIDLHCGVDEQRIRYIKGSVHCTAPVVCQRCLKPVEIEFSSDVSLGIVWTEDQAKLLPESMDSLVLGEDQLVDLHEIVEEELLLSLPFVSYHEVGECEGLQHYESVDEAYVAPVEKENPFKVLEQLKTSKE